MNIVCVIKLFPLCWPLLFFNAWFLTEGKPGVKIDSIQVIKREVFSTRTPATVRNIQSVRCNHQSKGTVALLGNNGVQMLNAEDYSPVKSYRFSKNNVFLPKKNWITGSNRSIVCNDGKEGFDIMLGGGGYSDIGLLNEGRNLIWTFKPNPKRPPNKMLSADLNGDGINEFYVADRKGLYQLSREGKTLKKFSDDPILDINTIEYPDGAKPLLIALNRFRNDCKFQLFNYDGKITKEIIPEYKDYRFDVVNWPDKPRLLMGYPKRKILLLDTDGKIVFEHKLANFPLYHKPKGAVVKFKKEEMPYLVVSARSRGGSRLTQLSVLSPAGKLVYQEVFNAWISMCVSPYKSDKSEVLLVADAHNVVWEYSLKSDKPLE
jgi:hypothetical protein